MSTSASHHRFAVVAALAVVATIAAAPASAVQSPPDIRGSYDVSGASIYHDCTGGFPNTTSATAGFFTITSQDGSAIMGNFGNPSANVVLINFQGQVAADGTITGTWKFGPAVSNTITSSDEMVTGQILGQKVAVEFTAAVNIPPFSCQQEISLSTGSEMLAWRKPYPNPANPTPPPADLTATPTPQAASRVAVTFADLGSLARSAQTAESPQDPQPTGYNVYRSKTPGVQTTPENLFTSVPPTQTSVPAPDGFDGSFFVVTATYPDGESGPSNEVSGGVPAAKLKSVKVTATKIVGKGTAFSNTVLVLVDGIPFASPAAVKGTTKVVQKGTLITGQSLSQYITSGREVAITFRNDNGGVATFLYTKP